VLDILGLADEPLVAGETKNVEVLHGDGSILPNPTKSVF
jgi:hypothetical protein